MANICVIRPGGAGVECGATLLLSNAHFEDNIMNYNVHTLVKTFFLTSLPISMLDSYVNYLSLCKTLQSLE